MITVKGNTARGRELVSRAIRYEGYDLYDVYGRVSQAKASAYRAGAIADKTREHYETLKQFVVNAWGVDPDFIEDFLNGEYIVIPEESLDIRGLK